MAPPTILIIDHDPSIREFLKLALIEEGYHPVLCSLQAGQNILTPAVPNLVLLDVPGVEPEKAVYVRQFRERLGMDVPMIILTTDLHPERVAQELHANCCIGKPFDLNELLRLIASNLRSGGLPARAS